MYVKDEILQQALKAIEEHDLTELKEVYPYLPCSKSILYETEDWKLEVLDPIKDALDQKKVSLKAKMKREWRKDTANPTLQIAAFKLMADEEELDKLTSNTNKNQHSGQIGITKISVVDVDGTEI